jgi:predicted secreted hydrolase
MAVTDIQKGIYATDQRTSFPSLDRDIGLGFDFKLGDWTMSGHNGHDQLYGIADGYVLDLTLDEEKPPVLHDRTGLVDFGEAGKSFYYSRTRMGALGTVSDGDKEVPVTGLAWFDHQWGNFDVQAIGWDWFALQFDDGSDVMLSRLWNEETEELYRYGTFVGADGQVHHLISDQFDIHSTGTWSSSVSGAVYPMGWQILIPHWGVVVTLSPGIQESEFDATSTTRNYYWEGEVVVSGSRSGKGFVELAGYDHLSGRAD